MNPARRLACRSSFLAAAAVLALAGTVQGGEQAGGVLYAGDGAWAVLLDSADSAVAPAPGWTREGDLWIGRWPSGGESLTRGDTVWRVADALPFPLAPTVLPPVRNAYGACVVRSLSLRFDSQIRAHRWSLVFAREGEAPAFVPLDLAHGEPVEMALSLEDAVSGMRWELTPERMGLEGGMFEQEKGESRLYAGMADEGRIEWHAVVARAPGGRRIVQVRLRTFEGPARLLRLRVQIRSATAGVPVLQEEFPPAVVTAGDSGAMAMFQDLAEPRRFRAVLDEPGWMGMEFDLAVARATGNFPRSATISVEVDAWESRGPEILADETVKRLVRRADPLPVPESILREGLGILPVYEPSWMVLSHPGGFRDREDVLHYLMMRMSGLFSDHDWAASAFLCAAQDAEGLPHIALAGDTAVMAVNGDPDLDTMLELGQNRGLTLLARVLREVPPAVWIQATGAASVLDHHARALHLCDYPAVWTKGTDRIGVELRHAEAELIASLACVLQERGIPLLISDDGPLAPVTTVHADALVCTSSHPAEMRRQRALAGPRPVLWHPDNPAPEIVALARDLEFASPGHFQED